MPPCLRADSGSFLQFKNSQVQRQEGAEQRASTACDWLHNSGTERARRLETEALANHSAANQRFNGLQPALVSEGPQP